MGRGAKPERVARGVADAPFLRSEEIGERKNAEKRGARAPKSAAFVRRRSRKDAASRRPQTPQDAAARDIQAAVKCARRAFCK